MVRCVHTAYPINSAPKESIAHSDGTHHPLLRHPRRRLLHHRRHSKGTRVAEYTGHKLTKEQADQAFEDSPITYLFGLGDGEIVIDGHSMAMFINHSCDPNCETEEKDGHVWIKAIRNIAPAEEITYDYCLYDGGDDEAICNCGAPKCRGTMYSREEDPPPQSRRQKSRPQSPQKSRRGSQEDRQARRCPSR